MQKQLSFVTVTEYLICLVVLQLQKLSTAMEAGADIVKIFPADLYGPKIIKDIKGPLPQAQMMPTGGVDKDNVADWIKAGVVAVGAGSSLTKGAKTATTTQLPKQLKNLLQISRLQEQNLTSNL